MNERLAEALAEVSGKHIAEAAAKKRHKKKFLGAIAAVLAVVLLMNMPHIPSLINARTVSKASGSRAAERPDIDDYKDNSEYQAASAQYIAYRDAQEQITEDALSDLQPFFAESTRLYMASSEKNRVWSPINGFIALGMMAEITGGESRQQVLGALGVDDLDTLRSYVNGVWEAVYEDGDYEMCILANSLWLDRGIGFDREIMDNVAYYHYASVFQKDLQSPGASKALATWLNNNTGGLLKKQADTAGFSPEAVLTLASTVYLQSKWADQFSAQNNTQDIFHAPSGDREVTFLNKKLYHMYYYWAEDFGAVNLSLKNGTRMWFFLPDEGKTPQDVLNGTEYLELLSDSYSDNEDCKKYLKVNLSVPKFDITSSGDVMEVFRALGITDIFDLGKSDFTAITADTPVVITGVNQAARVIIDEEGVKAASYLEFPGAGAAAPPEEIIDFILDRPFVFVIAGYQGVPLFTGVVNEP